MTENRGRDGIEHHHGDDAHQLWAFEQGQNRAKGFKTEMTLRKWILTRHNIVRPSRSRGIRERSRRSGSTTGKTCRSTEIYWGREEAIPACGTHVVGLPPDRSRRPATQRPCRV